MFLDFVNFYRRFIYYYLKRAIFFTSLLKENKNSKKYSSFI